MMLLVSGLSAAVMLKQSVHCGPNLAYKVQELCQIRWLKTMLF